MGTKAHNFTPIHTTHWYGCLLFILYLHALPHPLTSRGSAFLNKAGLLTSFHSQAPSRRQAVAFHLKDIKELTAAGQSETHTPFPF